MVVDGRRKGVLRCTTDDYSKICKSSERVRIQDSKMQDPPLSVFRRSDAARRLADAALLKGD